MGSAFSASAISGAGMLPGPAAPEPLATLTVCSSVCVSAPCVGFPAGATSATGSAGQHERAWESSRSERSHRCSSSGERSRSGERCRGVQSPSPACSSCQSRPSTSFSSASSDVGVRDGVMSPPHAGRPGTVGGRSEGDRSASGCDCSSPWSIESGLGVAVFTGCQAVSFGVWWSLFPPLLQVREMTTALL